jgi:hypothetical protein
MLTATTSCSVAPATPLESPTVGSAPISAAASPDFLSRPSSTRQPYTPSPSPPPFQCAFPSVSPPRSPNEQLDPGTYIAFFAPSPETTLLVIKSVEGETVRVVRMPPGSFLPTPEGESGISPDGKHFVYYTGSPSWGRASSAEGQYDLTLHIAAIASGNDVAAIPLLKPTLPYDIDQSAELLAQNPPPGSETESPSDIAAGLYDALLVGITTVGWSPDGRYLAFAGAIDGPSSDIYMYDASNRQIRRLTSGPEEIVKIAWSPDGEWIVHASATAWGLGSSSTNHAVRADASAVMTFPFGGPYDRGWLDARKYLVSEGANGIGSFDLAILDIERARRVSLWPYDFGAIAFDRGASQMLLANFGEVDGAPKAGLYMLDLVKGSAALVDPFPLWNVAYWPKEPYRFVAAKYDAALFGIMPDGTLVHLLDGDWSIYPSPDLNTLALSSHATTVGLFLIDTPDTPPRMLDEREAFGVKWSPDSTWIMFFPGPLLGDWAVSAVRRTGGQPHLIQVLPRGMCLRANPIWLSVR